MILLVLFGFIVLSGCAQEAKQPSANESAAMDGSQAEVTSVSIVNFAFSPATLTVPKGTTVTWTNEDSSSHTVTGGDFDSGTLAKGESYSHSFDEAGTFDYTCTIHPSMRGTLIVE